MKKYVLNMNRILLFILLFNTYINISFSITKTNFFNENRINSSLKSSANEKEPIWIYDPEISFQHEILSIDISSDGRYIVAGINNGKIIVLEYINSTLKRKLWEFQASCVESCSASVAISSDGMFIAAGEGKNVYFFSTSNPIPLWNYSDGNVVDKLAISSNGSYIALETGGINYGTYLFNSSITTPKSPMWNYSKDPYSHIAISADAFYIAASDNDLTALYNRTSAVPMITFWGRVYQLAISSNGSYIVTGGTTVRLYHKDNTTQLWEYNTEYVGSLDISSNGDYITAGEANLPGRAFLFHRTTQYVWSYKTESGSSYSLVAISSDGKYVAQATIDGLFVFDNVPSQSKKPLWSYSTLFYTEPAISSNGSYIACASGTGYIYLFYNEISPKQKDGIISFGTYYLLFLIIGVLSLIIILPIKNNLIRKKETSTT